MSSVMENLPFTMVESAASLGVVAELPEDVVVGWREILCFIIIVGYLVSEVLFWVYFQVRLMPMASQHHPPPEPYYDYPLRRDPLLHRIIQRLQEHSRKRQQDIKISATTDLLPWFKFVTANEITNSTTTATTTSATSESGSVPINLNVSSKLDATSIPPPPARLLSITSSTIASTTTASSSTSSCCDDNSSLGSEDDEAVVVNGISLKQPSTTQQQQHILDEDNEEEEDEEVVATWSVPGLTRKAMTGFLAWAFHAKDTADLNDGEKADVEACLVELQRGVGLTLEETSSHPLGEYVPRRMSLDPLQSLHRPWILYALFRFLHGLLRFVILPLLGFQRHVVVYPTTLGKQLVAWHRPCRRRRNYSSRHKAAAAAAAAAGPTVSAEATTTTTSTQIFFHGIAPAGLTFYTPMLTTVLWPTRHTSDWLWVENPSISAMFDDWNTSLTEKETMDGLWEILNKLNLQHTRWTLMGHSFGSCPITWTLRRLKKQQQQQERCSQTTTTTTTTTTVVDRVILLDPVTLLLSNPTVMVQFLYNPDIGAVRLFAGSEIFIEMYLRRHFAWYNSELFWNDYDDVVQNWTVVLSEADKIVPTAAVRQAILDDNNGCRIHVLSWPNAIHGTCVISPWRWFTLQREFFGNPSSSSSSVERGNKRKVV